MEYRILHHSLFTFAKPTHGCNLTARMAPRTQPGQTLHHHGLSIDPYSAQSWWQTDQFHNRVLRVKLRRPTDRLNILASARVSIPSHNQPDPLAWLDRPIAELRGYSPTACSPMAGIWHQPTTLTDINPDITALAEESLHDELSAKSALLALAATIRSRCAWRDDCSSSSTPATLIYAQRAGLCQDFAHLALACLRARGLPACYVSGYVILDAEKSPATRSLGHTHAWIAIPGPHAEQESLTGWVGLDPTSAAFCGSDYLALAIGRDFRDAAPLTGRITASTAQRLVVSVQCTAIP